MGGGNCKGCQCRNQETQEEIDCEEDQKKNMENRISKDISSNYFITKKPVDPYLNDETCPEANYKLSSSLKRQNLKETSETQSKKNINMDINDDDDLDLKNGNKNLAVVEESENNELNENGKTSKLRHVRKNLDNKDEIDGIEDDDYAKKEIMQKLHMSDNESENENENEDDVKNGVIKNKRKKKSDNENDIIIDSGDEDKIKSNNLIDADNINNINNNNQDNNNNNPNNLDNKQNNINKDSNNPNKSNNNDGTSENNNDNKKITSNVNDNDKNNNNIDNNKENQNLNEHNDNITNKKENILDKDNTNNKNNIKENNNKNTNKNNNNISKNKNNDINITENEKNQQTSEANICNTNTNNKRNDTNNSKNNNLSNSKNPKKNIYNKKFATKKPLNKVKNNNQNNISNNNNSIKNANDNYNYSPHFEVNKLEFGIEGKDKEKLTIEQQKLVEEAQENLNQFYLPEKHEETKIKNKLSKLKLSYIIPDYIMKNIQIDPDEILFHGELKKLINFEINAHKTRLYSSRFCILTINYFKYYKSQAQFLSKLKPQCVIPLNQITKISFAKIKKIASNVDHIIICNKLGITNNNDVISGLSNSVNLPDSNESLIIFSSDNEDVLYKWFVVLDYFLEKQKHEEEEEEQQEQQ